MNTVEPLLRRTPAKRKARELATTLRRERPDYVYLKELFRQLRVELGIAIPRTPERLPYVPSEEESAATIRRSGRPEGLATWC
jgi:hypothetical protein